MALAKKEGTAPHMVLSNLREPFGFDSAIAHDLLGNPSQWPDFIQKVMEAVLTHGYSGVDLDFEYVPKEDKAAYAPFCLSSFQPPAQVRLPADHCRQR